MITSRFYNRFVYRHLMRFAHRFNWHHMEVSHPEGDTMRWCHWCGIRVVQKPQTLADIPFTNYAVNSEAVVGISREDYSVTGSPRHIPWSRRKKELEASARQKRRHLESFTEKA